VRVALSLALLLIPGTVPAQQVAAPHTPAAARGAAAITATDVSRRIALIADDSMHGRATPSPELDKVAAYIAGEFKRFGLQPGGDSGTYLQRYALVVSRFLPESSSVWASGTASAHWSVGQDVLWVQGDPPPGPVVSAPVVVSGNPQVGGALDSATVAGRIAILGFGPQLNAIASKLLPLRPAAIILVGALPDSIWERLPGRSGGTRVTNPNEQSGPSLPAVLVTRAQTFAPWLSQAGVNPDSLLGSGAQPLAARLLASDSIHLVLWQQTQGEASAPNVVGILPGSDSVLRHQYVLFTAHMDHIGIPADGEGCAAKDADSICNGADDDGSGTVAVLELAQAYTSSPGRPKRSLIFMTVSGEERGLWGSGYFADHPTVPIDSVVADLNSDMVGRNWADTMAVIGREHSDLGGTLDSVAARHPELHMTPVGDRWPQEGLYFRSDHFNFARKGVPVLFFTSGLHPDYHQVSDSPEKIDGEKEARFTQLLYYLGMEVANAAAKPQWNPDSYRKIVLGEP
jgi:Peptidase family M28